MIELDLNMKFNPFSNTAASLLDQSKHIKDRTPHERIHVVTGDVGDVIFTQDESPRRTGPAYRSHCAQQTLAFPNPPQ